MKELIRNKSFVLGFIFGLIIIGLLNKFTADFSQVVTWHCYRELYGFPFLQYERCDGDITYTHLYWLGVIGNILFAITFSFILGLIFKSIWSKFSSKNLK